MRDRVVLWIVGIVGVFVIFSLLAQFLLVYSGRITGDEGVWRPLFDLMAILVGAVAGYIGGVEVQRLRDGNDPAGPAGTETTDDDEKGVSGDAVQDMGNG